MTQALAMKHDGMDDHDALIKQAQIHMNAGELAQAIQACQEALEIRNDLETNIFYVRLLIKIKKYPTALAVIEKLTKQNRSNYIVDELAAHIHTKKGNFDRAIALLETAIQKRPTLKAATTALARLYYLKEDIERAAVYIKQSINHSPQKMDVNALKGRIDTSLGNLKEAHRHFLWCEEESQTFISAIDLANTELDRGNIENYQKFFSKAIERCFSFTIPPSKRLDALNSATLYITLSPHAGNFILTKYPFKGDVIAINDQSDTFYTFSREPIAQFLSGIIQKQNYSKVVLIGSSKGGTGAIQISTRLAEMFPDLTIQAFAFSPQTKIWPYNSNLEIHSYWTLKERCQGNKLLEKAISSNGDVDVLFKDSFTNLSVTILYGNKHAMDTREVEKLTQILKLYPCRSPLTKP